MASRLYDLARGRAGRSGRSADCGATPGARSRGGCRSDRRRRARTRGADRGTARRRSRLLSRSCCRSIARPRRAVHDPAAGRMGGCANLILGRRPGCRLGPNLRPHLEFHGKTYFRVRVRKGLPGAEPALADRPPLRLTAGPPLLPRFASSPALTQTPTSPPSRVLFLPPAAGCFLNARPPSHSTSGAESP